MEIKNVIISIVLGLILFGAGAGLGILYQIQKQPQPIVAPIVTPITPQAIKDLSSSLIPSISVYGAISKITDRNLTVTKNGENMTIAIRPDAKIYSFVVANPIIKGKPTSITKVIDFKDIKIGDNVSITVRVLSNGQIEGLTVVLLPPTATVTPTPVAR